MVRVGILGATSYTSRELIGVLLRHPLVEIAYLGSRRDENPVISEVFPVLMGLTALRCSPLEPAAVPPETQVILSTLPDGVAMEMIPAFLEAGFRVIDFSGDYRLKSRHEYEKWYGRPHTDEGRLAESVFGIPEIYREQIARARLVANPGCYATGAILGLAPLLRAGTIESEDIVVDAKSGVSGAGRTPTERTHFPECNESVEAYKIGVHDHTPEITQCLGDVAGVQVKVTFVPHLVPMDRGILCTSYARLQEKRSEAELLGLMKDFYSGSPFVRLRKSSERVRTKDVVGSNFCDICVTVAGDRAIVVSCLDNLGKGASWQAVQNLNVMCGLPDTKGLLP